MPRRKKEKKKNRSLQESQKRLSQIITQTPAAVIEWSPNFNFQSWNPAAEDIFGYRSAEIVGEHFLTIFPTEYRDYVDDVATQILAICIFFSFR